MNIDKHTVLILGGAGFIGSYVTDNLFKLGHKVVILDSFTNFLDHEKSGYRKYFGKRLEQLQDKAKIIKGDVLDTAQLVQVIKENKPDTILLLAGIPLATACNKLASDALDINLNGTISVMRAIGATSSVRRLIYSSSSFVYGNFQYVPCDEKHPLSPIDVYGGTKLASEDLIRGFSVRYDLEYTIIRPSAVYGPYDSNLRVSQIFVENALAKKPLVIHDGEATLDFTYVKDTAEGFTLAIIKPEAKNEIFNITRGEGRSLLEFAEILKKLIPDVEIKYEPGREDEKRPLRGSLDITKAKNLLGYKPRYSLEDGLKEYVDFVKNFQTSK